MAERHRFPSLIVILLVVVALVASRLVLDASLIQFPKSDSDLLPIEGKHHVMWSQSSSNGYPTVPRTKEKKSRDAIRKNDRSKNNAKNHQSREASSTNKNPSIQRIFLIGERHSGTKYLTKLLKRCFPALHATDSFVRYKHWFQPSPAHVVNATNNYEAYVTPRAQDTTQKRWPLLAALENTTKAFSDGLLVAVFRNPYDWMEAMRNGPHHWPNHMKYVLKAMTPEQINRDRIKSRRETMRNRRKHYGMNVTQYKDNMELRREIVRNRRNRNRMNMTQHRRLGQNRMGSMEMPSQMHYEASIFPWEEFISANMMLSQDDANHATHLCQEGYLSGQVSPCRLSRERYPPEVRKDFQDLTKMPKGLIFSGHEPIYELNADTERPFEHPLQLRAAKIRNYLNVPKKWELGGFLTVTNEEIDINGAGSFIDQVSQIVGLEPKCRAEPPANKQGYELDPEWAEWITQHADWSQEARLGYTPRDPTKSTE